MLFRFSFLTFLLATAPLPAADAIHHCGGPAAALPVPGDLETRVEGLLARLTLDEKIEMLAGEDTGFNSRGVPRLGIPPIRMADGPVGVRAGVSTAFPVSVNMAASWDTALIHRFGIALAEETLANGKHCILAPCVGIGRFPLGGRNFEAFGEDPYLSARIGVSVITGVQSQGVIATVKHFACNDQEWRRWDNNAVVDERALHETHLFPFEAAVKEAGVWMLMTSYNKVNGHYTSEHARLVNGILKNEWGYKGLVVSDWVSVHSTVEAANHGLDIEMPNPVWFGDKLRAAVRDGLVPVSVIDDKVRRHLRVRFLAGVFDRPEPAIDHDLVLDGAHRTLAREMAQKSMVLLKNDGLLPLSPERLRTLALVGPNAAVTRSGGGGSSGIWPWVSVSPVKGFRTALSEEVAIVTATGVQLDRFTPVTVDSAVLSTPDGTAPGLLGEYFANTGRTDAPVFTRVDRDLDFRWQNTGPGEGIGGYNYSVRWTGRITPKATQAYDFVLNADDDAKLFIDDEFVTKSGDDAVENTGLRLEAGRSYRLRLEYTQNGGNASFRFGWRDPADTALPPTIADAATVAAKADAVVLCVGLSAEHEHENTDLAGFEFIKEQDKLIEAVLAANPNTVVVVYGGVPMLLKPWIAKARAVVAAFYPGQEGGAALADLLLGARSFSGKLPFSYIQSKEESPGFLNYMNPDLQVPYAEGVFVGYKHLDAHGGAPLFPFGHGLSYTTFEYSGIVARPTGPAAFAVDVTVANTGTMAGDEVVQLYVEPKQSRLPRPVRELRGFARVALQPGEAKTVTLALDARAFSYYDPEKRAWVSEPGDYVIHAAASSRDLRQATKITLK